MLLAPSEISGVLTAAAVDIRAAVTVYSKVGSNPLVVAGLLDDATLKLAKAIPAYNNLFPLPGAASSREAIQQVADGVAQLSPTLAKGSKFIFSPVPNMTQWADEIDGFAFNVSNKLHGPQPMLS